MIREKLVEMMKNAEGDFLSGEELSRRLNCSRTAIWKHIEELRKEGYRFEAVRKAGYRLVHTPDRVSAEEIKAGLTTDRFGNRIVYREQVDSTQSLAQTKAKEGAAEGTLVVADEQIGGKGRMGRPWHSQAQAGIWMSLILRPPIPLQQTPQLTLVAAVAACRAIRKETALEAGIKWPNDIFINGKKTCGILTELNAEPDRVNFVVVGTGMNVNTADFPDELKPVATSLRLESGRTFHRANLIRRYLNEWETLYDHYVTEGFPTIKEEWESYDLSIGRTITVRTLNGTKKGTALALNDEGALLFKNDQGETEKIYSADIEMNT